MAKHHVHLTCLYLNVSGLSLLNVPEIFSQVCNQILKKVPLLIHIVMRYIYNIDILTYINAIITIVL